LDVSLVRLRNELLKLREVSLATLGVSENKLRVDHMLLEHGASHEEVLHKLLIAVLVVGGTDDKCVH
jgi:hypothetical protein